MVEESEFAEAFKSRLRKRLEEEIKKRAREEGSESEEDTTCGVCEVYRAACKVLGNDATCREMTEKVIAGEITGDEYDKFLQQRYGRKKAEEAMVKANFIVGEAYGYDKETLKAMMKAQGVDAEILKNF